VGANEANKLMIERVLLTAFFGIVGAASLFHSVFGKTFHFVIPVSAKPGPAMPKWLARPFFFFMGVVLFLFAYKVWTGGVDLR
jgi:hypothetical protein